MANIDEVNVNDVATAVEDVTNEVAVPVEPTIEDSNPFYGIVCEGDFAKGFAIGGAIVGAGVLVAHVVHKHGKKIVTTIKGWFTPKEKRELQ